MHGPYVESDRRGLRRHRVADVTYKQSRQPWERGGGGGGEELLSEEGKIKYAALVVLLIFISKHPAETELFNMLWNKC